MPRPQLASLSVALILAAAAGCQASGDPGPGPRAELELRAGPRPEGEDLGPRRFADSPHDRRVLCPAGTDCRTMDINYDGKQDLIRFDPAGVFGAPGATDIAYSNGWDFGPMSEASPDFCPEGVYCLAADVDGDRFADLVRFGRLDYRAEVALALQAGGYGSAYTWASNVCGPSDTCTAADVNGDGTADLVTIVGKGSQLGDDDEVFVSLSDPSGYGHAPTLWAQGVCGTGSGPCRVADINGDGLADLTAIGEGQSGVTHVYLSNAKSFKAEQAAPWASLSCAAGAICELGDFDGDWNADIIAHFPGLAQTAPDSCSGRCGGAAEGCDCDDVCTQHGDCCADYQPLCLAGQTCAGQCGGSANGCWCDPWCTQYGDCCSDYAPQCDPAPFAAQVHVWAAEPAVPAFGPATFVLDTGCAPTDTCWSADVTGDGRTDLVVVHDDGTLELFHSQDGIDRMEDHALRLSLLRTDFELRRAAVSRREFAALVHDALPVSPELAALLPERFGPVPPASPPTTTDPAPAIEPLPDMAPWPDYAPGSVDSAWYSARITTFAEQLQTEAEAILDAVPPEGSLVEPDQQLRWQQALGKIVAARTVLYAPPLAVSPRAANGACSNAVLHDRPRDGSRQRVEGSYLARYYDALREHEPNDRIDEALPALTGIVEGMRCLSQGELAGLESAFVDALTDTMDDLLSRGQPALAQVLWDQALPIELILFDGVKGYATPAGWRMLQVRIEDGAVVLPPLPEPGDDFDAFFVEDGTTCSTIRCGLYKHPRRETATGQFLTLDTLGVWLPDLTERERLRRSTWYPEQLLDAMVNLKVLGEGDCGLIELGPFNPTCTSYRTCEFSQELAAMPNSLELTVQPGGLASEFTHFGTSRADLPSENACGEASGGGGGAPMACLGPELRGHQGRFAPLDPELDRIMSCTFESFGTATPTAALTAVDLSFAPECLLGADPPEPVKEVTNDNLEEGRQGVQELLINNAGVGTDYGHDRDVIAGKIAAVTGASLADVLAAMAAVATSTLGVPAKEWRRALGDASPLGTHFSYAPDKVKLNYMDITVNEKHFNNDLRTLLAGAPVGAIDGIVGEYIFRGILHESVHMTIHLLVHNGDAPAYLHGVKLHHEVTNALGLTRATRSCDTTGVSCDTRCGFSDARIQRFTECLIGDDPTPVDRCAIAEDYCDGRSLGTLDFPVGPSCAAPSVSLPPLCATVSCDTSSAVQSQCCGSAGGGEPPPYPGLDASPGPHPGDPDGPYGPIPGGPGGVPIPPIPSPF